MYQKEKGINEYKGYNECVWNRAANVFEFNFIKSGINLTDFVFDN